MSKNKHRHQTDKRADERQQTQADGNKRRENMKVATRPMDSIKIMSNEPTNRESQQLSSQLP